MAARKATTATKSTATRSAVRKSAVKKGAAAKRAVTKTPSREHGPRKDLGAPADGYFARQAPDKRALLEALRALVKQAAPDARESIKWGMPFYEKNGSLCALASFKSYVSLNVFAPPDVLEDPEGKLEGSGKSMRHLKVRSESDIDEAGILRWLKAAARHNA
jgi:hypothetical protein